MHPAIIALVTSFCVVSFFTLLFRYERARGVRLGEHVRAHLDFFLLKARHMMLVRFRIWGTYVIRQILQYLFHTFLRGIIKGLGILEERLTLVLRSNRTLAKKSDVERSTRTKLEEIAIHKMEVALTEREKRVRRQKSLEG